MTNATCTEPECTGQPVARKLCRRHYNRLYTSAAFTLQPRHILSNVDPEAATAECSLCGETRIRVRGNGKSHECWTVSKRNKRERNLKWKYGISKAERDAMADEQNHLCAICGKGPDQLVVDHDHGTGLVRQLLCGHCNTALGFLMDDVDTARAAVEYLLKHAA